MGTSSGGHCIRYKLHPLCSHFCRRQFVMEELSRLFVLFPSSRLNIHEAGLFQKAEAMLAYADTSKTFCAAVAVVASLALSPTTSSERRQQAFSGLVRALPKRIGESDSVDALISALSSITGGDADQRVRWPVGTASLPPSRAGVRPCMLRVRCQRDQASRCPRSFLLHEAASGGSKLSYDWAAHAPPLQALALRLLSQVDPKSGASVASQTAAVRAPSPPSRMSALTS